MTFYHVSSSRLGDGSVIEPGNWGRIIQEVGPAHNRWLAEVALEHVREAEFPHLPSRWRAAFFCDELQIASRYRDAHSPVGLIYEVEILDVDRPFFRTDYRANVPDHIPTLDWCRRYWLGDNTPTPPDGVRFTEILAIARLRIVKLM